MKNRLRSCQLKETQVCWSSFKFWYNTYWQLPYADRHDILQSKLPQKFPAICSIKHHAAQRASAAPGQPKNQVLHLKLNRLSAAQVQQIVRRSRCTCRCRARRLLGCWQMICECQPFLSLARPNYLCRFYLNMNEFMHTSELLHICAPVWLYDNKCLYVWVGRWVCGCPWVNYYNVCISTCTCVYLLCFFVYMLKCTCVNICVFEMHMHYVLNMFIVIAGIFVLFNMIQQCLELETTIFKHLDIFLRFHVTMHTHRQYRMDCAIVCLMSCLNTLSYPRSNSQFCAVCDAHGRHVSTPDDGMGWCLDRYCTLVWKVVIIHS